MLGDFITFILTHNNVIVDYTSWNLISLLSMCYHIIFVLNKMWADNITQLKMS